jgi:hypothetical protein
MLKKGDSEGEEEARTVFILREGVLRFGLPVSLIVAFGLYGSSHRLTWWSLLSPAFLIDFAIAFVCCGLIGGHSWGAQLWRKDHEE